MSPPTCARSGRRITSRRRACSRPCSPRCRCAWTTRQRRSSGKATSSALPRRVGERIMEGKPVGMLERVQYGLGDLAVYGPLRNVLGMGRIRIAYTGGEAIGPDLFVFYRSLGVNLKQL